jgi:hypothetical protein
MFFRLRHLAAVGRRQPAMGSHFSTLRAPCAFHAHTIAARVRPNQRPRELRLDWNQRKHRAREYVLQPAANPGSQWRFRSSHSTERQRQSRSIFRLGSQFGVELLVKGWRPAAAPNLCRRDRQPSAQSRARGIGSFNCLSIIFSRGSRNIPERGHSIASNRARLELREIRI